MTMLDATRIEAIRTREDLSGSWKAFARTIETTLAYGKTKIFNHFLTPWLLGILRATT
jgi:hypothetical protein